MHLYLRNVPRALYLVTDSHDEKLGRPPRALVFRAGDGLPKVIVEFLPKDQVDMHALVKLSSRNVKGCLGLISVENGVCVWNDQPCKSSRVLLGLMMILHFRYVPRRRHERY